MNMPEQPIPSREMKPVKLPRFNAVSLSVKNMVTAILFSSTNGRSEAALLLPDKLLFSSIYSGEKSSVQLANQPITIAFDLTC